jgi:1-deoxy-D-xylulose-5-phosphate reductoisomerase
MGRKITLDSATLMNKGLEVVEARWLFGMRADQIAVVIHPQSVVHSMIELVDGSLIAHLGVTDMQLPIQYAFSYPERWPAPLAPLDVTQMGPLDFAQPDTEAFPCLRLAYRALEAEDSLPVVLNAANEVAVARFLQGHIGFASIPAIIEQTMDAHELTKVPTLAAVRAVDEWARAHAEELARGIQL